MLNEGVLKQIWKVSFFMHKIDIWNMLPQQVVESDTITMFKGLLGRQTGKA